MTALRDIGRPAARGPDGQTRLSALERLTTELARAVDRDRIAELLVDHGVRAVGAVTAALWTVEGAALRIVRALGYPESLGQRFRALPIDATTPIGDAIRAKRPLFLESYDEYVKGYPESAGAVRGAPHPPGAIVCLPLVASGVAIGALTFGFEERRDFDREDVTYFDLVAAHAVQAIERARLWKAEKEARARVELLYGLADAAIRAATLDDVFAPALEAVCGALGYERASILLSDESGTMRFRAWRGLSETYRQAADGHSPWTRDEKDPQPIVVADAETDASMEPYRAIFRAEDIRALVFVPLVHESRLLGKFMAYGASPRALSADEVRLATTIAAQIAQAVAHHEAREALVRAKTGAEEAALARDRLLAVVAHDLRNPLGVVQLKSQLMARRADVDPKAKRDAEIIARNGELMTRLIDDLVDVSAIEANRLSIDREPIEASEVLSDVREHARALAEPRGIALIVQDDTSGAKALGDRQRLVQILSNLVGNAMKFSPARGVVTIAAKLEGDDVVFSVADDGPGIPPDERARVFERWFSGGRSRPKPPPGVVRGLGLGLYISRGLVEAHGGEIHFADTGRGTCVVFTVPRV